MLGYRLDVLCPSLGGDGVGGRDFMVLFLGCGLSISVEFCWELPEGCVWVVRLDRV